MKAPYVSDQAMDEAMVRLSRPRPTGNIMSHTQALGRSLPGTTVARRENLLNAVFALVPTVTAAERGTPEDAIKLAFTLGVQLGREVS